MSGVSVLQHFEAYQKSRVTFVQAVAEAATRPQNIEVMQNAGVMQLLRPLLLDNVSATISRRLDADSKSAAVCKVVSARCYGDCECKLDNEIARAAHTRLSCQHFANTKGEQSCSNAQMLKFEDYHEAVLPSPP